MLGVRIIVLAAIVIVSGASRAFAQTASPTAQFPRGTAEMPEGTVVISAAIETTEPTGAALGLNSSLNFLSERGTREADTHSFGVCPGYIEIAQGPADTIFAPTVAVTVVYGDSIGAGPGGGFCVAVGTSWRSFTVNGQNRSNYFTYDTGPDGENVMSATALPLEQGVLNTLVATADSYDEDSDPIILSDVWVTQSLVVSHSPAIEPDGSVMIVEVNASRSQQFTVTNAGTVSSSFYLTATCTGTVTSCTPSLDSLSLAPEQSQSIEVSYNAGASGGTVALRANYVADSQVRDSATVQITIGSVGPPNIAVQDLNEGETAVPGECLTIMAGESADYQCGNLRIAHALPTTITLNKPRTPILVYNTQFAHPHPIISALVTIPAGHVIPVSVEAVITINGVQRGPVFEWNGADWTPGVPRLIAVSFDALAEGLATDLYDYTLEITNVYSNDRESATAQHSLAIVNRSLSPFGAGFWLAGLEHLDPATMVWTGGDGSMRQYHATGITNVWAAPAVDRVDTLKYDPAKGRYARLLSHGVRVEFSQAGQHIATINRVGDSTNFAYTSGLLTSITLPPTGSSKSYSFYYHQVSGVARLDSVVAPPDGSTVRRTALTLDGATGRVMAIRDADNLSTGFSYHQTESNVITGRTNRQGTRTSYSFDSAWRLSQASLDTGQAKLPWIVSTIRAAESLGLPDTSGAGSADTADVFTRLDGPRPLPVGDTTLFWLTPFGSPRKIVDAVGRAFSMERADSRFPALVTALIAPSGFRTEAEYDARGNIRLTRAIDPYGVSDTALTTYSWKAPWDFVASIVPPLGDSTVFEYDAVGNRIWVQTGSSSARRVNFAYNAHGQVLSTTLPLTTPDSVGYDALGNLSSTRSPAGLVTTYDNDDVGRRIASEMLVTDSTIEGRQRSYAVVDSVFYDVMGRDTLTVRAAPGDSVARLWENGFHEVVAQDFLKWDAPTVRVSKAYDSVGNVVRVSRDAFRHAIDAYGAPQSTVIRFLDTLITRYIYDPANRKVKEISPDLKVDSLVYDLAGNVTKQITRRGHSITTEYDALNRMTYRHVPAVSFADTTYAGVDMPHYIPPFGGSNPIIFGVNLPEDVQTFEYDDETGALRVAANHDAIVSRTYYPNGQLQSERQRIANYAFTSYTQHDFELHFAYDLNGRRISLEHPSELLDAEVSDSTKYHFNSLGQLDSLSTPYGESFAFSYDNAGRPSTIQFPNGVIESRQYDTAQRLIRQRTYNAKCLAGGCGQTVRWNNDPGFAGGEVFDNVFRYDSRGKRIFAADTLTPFADKMQYSPNGELVRTMTFNGFTIHSHKMSAMGALGNTLQSLDRSGTNSLNVQLYEYEPETSRLMKQMISIDQDTIIDVAPSVYDEAGNLRFQHRSSRQYRCESNPVEIPCFVWHTVLRDEVIANYYGADQRLRVMDRKSADDIKYPGGLEDYRYDALGRRVLRRFRRECRKGYSDINAVCKYNGRTVRYVYDGDQILYEIAAPGLDTSSAFTLERDLVPLGVQSNNYGVRFGVVLYTHGLELDRPLAATRTDMGCCAFIFRTVFLHPGPSGRFEMGTDTAGERELNAAKWYMKRYDYSLSPVTSDLEDEEIGTSWFGSMLEVQTDGSQNVYMRNRYYDPASGRFTQEDPIGLAGGMNLYGYANGDPVNLSDPFGLCPIPPSSCLGREGADLAIGFTPGLASIDDAKAILTGKTLTGTDVGIVGRFAAVAGFVTPATGGEIRAGMRAATKGLEGVYEFIAKSGRKYIGQSKDVWRRLLEHMRGPNARLSPDDLGTVRVKSVPGGKSARLDVEQELIDANGGVTGGKIDNKINAKQKP